MNQLYSATAVTDKNGELMFDELPLGLYLVARTKTASERNITITSFSAKVPFFSFALLSSSVAANAVGTA